MSTPLNGFRSPLIQAFLVAVVLVGLLFIWQGNIGFGLADEGYLWYGVQRTLLGEIPIRDFMSYDPGRYYWSATLMSLSGQHGIMALRASIAVFQTMGLGVGLWLVTRSQKKQSFIYVLLSGIILVAWMFPRHKLFDISISLFLMGVFTLLIENPNKKSFFLAGFFIGLFAVFGRNHGVYALASSLGVFIWLNIKKEMNLTFCKSTQFWVIGIIVGFSPILLMLLFVPGFAAAFIDSIRFLFEIKATNLALPWPWRIDFATLSHHQILNSLVISLFFIAILLFGILSVIWVFWQKWRHKPITAAFVAAAFAALPYTHYAYSRADISHLAQGIFPFLIGSLVILANQPAKIKWSLALLLCIATLLTISSAHPGWQCRHNQQCVNIQVSGNTLKVDANTAANVALLRQLAEQYAPQGRSFVVTPLWPGAYALLERKAPMMDIYALFPRSAAFQKKEIEAIKMANPGFILILDIPLDGREDLRFKNLDPLIYQYIILHFKPLSHKPSPEITIYTPKKATP